MKIRVSMRPAMGLANMQTVVIVPERGAPVEAHIPQPIEAAEFAAMIGELCRRAEIA